MKGLKLPSRNALLLNGAAILVAGASAAVAVRSSFFAEEMPSCRERFTTATRFSLERDGAARNAADLQGELSNSDWGLLSGSRVVKLKSGPAKHALELDLSTAPSVSRGTADRRAGIGFSWSPQTFERPEAACLAYSVFLPEGFSFGRGGRLPGLEGTEITEKGDTQPGFSFRYSWNAAGELDVYPLLPDWPEGRTLGGKKGRIVLEPGSWTELEQEIVLNTPGKANGVLRVWQNGRLAIQRTDVVFRSKSSVALSSVLAETTAGDAAPDTKPGPQKVWLTPFELRWQ